MTIIVPVAINPPPLPIPDPTDRTTFTARKLSEDDWTRNVFRAGALALANSTYTNAQDAQANATTVATLANSTAINANLAASYGGASSFVAGSTYDQFTVKFSPINQRSYRKVGATGVNSTDPSLDSANWQLISFDLPVVIVNTSSFAIVQGYSHVVTFPGAVALTGPGSAPTASFGILIDNGREDNTFNPNGFPIYGTSGVMTLDDAFGNFIFRYVNDKYRISNGL